ncbi:MAG: osmoprotectant transport system permease protein [Acidimicrobiaceae bacterium]|nr:osmoprotectant transport system permease protein [Acidimicrobiaceae bacterium]
MNWNGHQLAGNWDVIRFYSLQHLRLSLISLVLGVTAAAPLILIARRSRRSYSVILAVTNVLYAIPSLTLFLILATVLGLLNDKPIVVALAIYTLTIIVRNTIEGLRAVSPYVVDAARAMGYRSTRQLVHVELPLAMPAIAAGLRVATVSTISLVSVAGIIGHGGLGQMFNDGFQRRIYVEVTAALVASVVLAVALDLLLYLGQRAVTPWARSRLVST